MHNKIQEMTSSELDAIIALITHKIAQDVIKDMSEDDATIRELQGIDFWLNVTGGNNGQGV